MVTCFTLQICPGDRRTLLNFYLKNLKKIIFCSSVVLALAQIEQLRNVVVHRGSLTGREGKNKKNQFWGWVRIATCT